MKLSTTPFSQLSCCLLPLRPKKKLKLMSKEFLTNQMLLWSRNLTPS